MSADLNQAMFEKNARLSLECNDKQSSSGSRANNNSVSQAEEMREYESKGKEQSNFAYEADERSEPVGTYTAKRSPTQRSLRTDFRKKGEGEPARTQCNRPFPRYC